VYRSLPAKRVTREVPNDSAGSIRSQRAADDLRELYRLSAPHIGVPDVEALRDRVRVTVGAMA